MARLQATLGRLERAESGTDTVRRSPGALGGMFIWARLGRLESALVPHTRLERALGRHVRQLPKPGRRPVKGLRIPVLPEELLDGQDCGGCGLCGHEDEGDADSQQAFWEPEDEPRPGRDQVRSVTDAALSGANATPSCRGNSVIALE